MATSASTYFEYTYTRYAYISRGAGSRPAGGDSLRNNSPAASRVALYAHGPIVLCPGAGPAHRSRARRHIRRPGEAGARRYPPTHRPRQPGLLSGRQRLPDLRGTQERLSEDRGIGRRDPASSGTARIPDPRRSDPRICRDRNSSSGQRRGPDSCRRCHFWRRRHRPYPRASASRARNQPGCLLRRRVPIEAALAASFRDIGLAGAVSLRRWRSR